MLAPAWLIFTLKASPDEPNKDSLSWDPDPIKRGDSVATATGTAWIVMELLGIVEVLGTVDVLGIVDALGIVEVWEPLLTTEDTVWETRGPIWARI